MAYFFKFLRKLSSKTKKNLDNMSQLAAIVTIVLSIRGIKELMKSIFEELKGLIENNTCDLVE